MKLEFKTVKEFLSFLIQDDLLFLEQYDVSGYDYVCFDVDPNFISVYVYNSKKAWNIGSDLIDNIYGQFFEDGGSIDLSCDNYWALPFKISGETLSVGSIYKIKIQPPVKISMEEPEKFIEL